MKLKCEIKIDIPSSKIRKIKRTINMKANINVKLNRCQDIRKVVNLPNRQFGLLSFRKLILYTMNYTMKSIKGKKSSFYFIYFTR